MAPPRFNDSAYDEEVETRTDVRVAIDLALGDVLDDPAARELTDVEEQKLTHFAIRDLELPLTRSWYLAGGHIAAQPSVDRRSLWEPGESYGDLQSQQVSSGDQINEIREYFRSAEFIPGYSLRNVWYTDKFDFLRDYYRQVAPDIYRDLYLHSLDIREALWNLSEVIDSESTNTALSAFGIGEPTVLLPRSQEETIRHYISDFHMDLSEIDELNPTKEMVVRGTDIIELILSKLTHLDTTTADQRSILQSAVHDFFYYYVWKYPALAVSIQTTSGPNSDTLRQQRLLEFNNFDEQLGARIDSFSRDIRRVGLLPEFDDSVSEQDERSAYLHSILKESVDPR